MNKQEAVDQLKESLSKMIENIEDENGFNKGYRYATQHCFDIIKQLDEPEKPVVPQYVADYIEENKDALKEYVFTNVQVVLPIIPTENPMYKWLNGKGIGIIVDCIREGYEVEKEELYTVRFKFLEDNGYNYLVKLTDTDRFFYWLSRM